jgi:membrane associated rhomboid family serine protease
MGIYDRDYYHEDSGGWWGAVTGHQATWGLIAVTVGVFVAQVVTRLPGGQWPPDLISEWAAFTLPDVLHGQVWRLLTAHFVHTPYSLLGVALGMLGLWWFGSAVEAVYGPREFLAFYLTSGLAITAGEVLLGLAGWNRSPVYFGCWGVMTAVLVLYALHFPHHRILVMFIIPVPAWLLVTVIVGIALLAALNDPLSGPGPTLIAAAFAFVYYRAQVRISAWIPRLPSLSAGRRPALRVVPESEEAGEPVAAAASGPPKAAAGTRPGRTVDEQLEAKLDHVLEKVSRYGRESLTPEEREILLRASEVYKRRRGQ